MNYCERDFEILAFGLISRSLLVLPSLFFFLSFLLLNFWLHFIGDTSNPFWNRAGEDKKEYTNGYMDGHIVLWRDQVTDLPRVTGLRTMTPSKMWWNAPQERWDEWIVPCHGTSICTVNYFLPHSRFPAVISTIIAFLSSKASAVRNRAQSFPLICQ